MPPDALPSCLKSQATVVSAAAVAAATATVVSPTSTPACLSAASSIDNLATSLGDLTVGGATGPADGACGSDRKEGDRKSVV